MERRRQVLLKYIPEEEESSPGQLPDTPMFRHAGRVTARSQEHIQKELHGHPEHKQRSSTESLQVPESVDNQQQSPPESQVKAFGSRLNSSDKATNFTDSDGMISRSKSTVSISSEHSQLQRLRKSQAYNQRIIRQLTNVNKQLQSKLDCYELSNNELRLQLLERSGECTALKQFIQTLRYQYTQEHVSLKNQIMLLQDRLSRQDICPSNISLDRPVAVDSEPHHPAPQHQTRKKLREILLKNSLAQSSIDSNQNHKPHSSSSFKLKSFRNSLSNLRNEDCSVDRSRQKENTFDEPPPQQLREQLQKLQCKMEHLADQQKLLSFKNSLLQMKIK